MSSLLYLKHHVSPKFCDSHFYTIPVFRLPTVRSMLNDDFFPSHCPIPTLWSNSALSVKNASVGKKMQVCILCVLVFYKHLFDQKKKKKALL